MPKAPAPNPVFAPLANVSGTDLRDLIDAEDDTVLAQSIKRLLQDLDDGSDVIAAWSSYSADPVK